MKILKIALKNLNSLKLDTVIDFTAIPLQDAGLFAIVGDTGAGKTTILDALTLGLYGRVHRNKDEGEVLSYGAVDGHAEVEFLVKEEIYRTKWVIWRSRGKVDGKINTKRELAQWNTEKEIFEILGDKVRDINGKVEEITGLDYERFTKSVMLSQGDFAAFLKAGDKERSNLLERITGTEIYSQISMAAFRKHKLEEQKINDLKRELDALQILDPETLKDLKKDLKDLQKESKTQQKLVGEISAQIQWRNRVVELENQKVTFAAAAENAEQKMAIAAPEFAKLTAHQKTLVFQKELTKLEGLEASQSNLLDDKEELEIAIKNYQIKKDELAEQSAALATKLKAIKKDKTEKETIFQKVNALDVKLEEKQKPFQQIQQEKVAIDKEVADNQRTIQEVLQKEETGKDTVLKINEWFEKQERFKNVANVLPALRNLLADWSEQESEQKALEIEQSEKEKALNKALNFLKEFDSKLTQENERLNLAGSNFSTENVLNRGQFLEQLNQDLEALDIQVKNLEMLINLNEDYLELIKELNEYDEEIIDLESKRGMIEMRLLTAIEMEESVKERYDFKLQMFEQQKLLANYDRERTNLVEGEKCPLCFSTTHPFRDLKEYKPYVDESEAEYLAVKAQLDLMTKEKQKLSFRLSDIGVEIQQIIGEQEKNLDGKRDIILKQIKAAESKIALIAPELTDENLYHTRKGTILREKLDVIKISLVAKRKERTDLIALNQEIVKQEKAISALQQEHTEQKIGLTNLQGDHKNIQQKLAALTKKQTALRKKIDKELDQFDFSTTEKSAEEILNALAQKADEFERANLKLIDLNKKAALTEQELKQSKKQEKEVQKRATNIYQQFEKIQSEITDLQQDRQKIFGNQQVEIVRNQLNQSLESTETRVERISQELKEAEIQLKSELAKAKKNAKDLEKVAKDLAEQTEQLLGKIQEKGFANIDALKMANLSPDEVSQLENLKESLQKQLTEQQQSLKNALKELTATVAKALTTESKETLQEKHQETDQQAQYLLQQIGKITQQIEDNDRRKQAGKALVEKMDIQQKEFRRWAKLKDIIGSADGKVFRAFAQGLTLKKLSELANRHLLQLNGRYLIHKPNDRDLALEIIDQHHANNIRSIHTLSGGESFLVSLALALGLSDLAGRNTQIKSLFIDEGFGTLDESALDLAISTLENLQSKGKRIGVISHVSALKERITTQIQVQKRGSGFSELEIVG